MNRRLVCCATFVAFTLLTPSPAAVLSGQRRLPNALEDLESYINRALKDWQNPGLSLAIVKDDTVIMAGGFGLRELGKADRVDGTTLFAIGSCSKAFAAATVGELVDSKRLAWEDRVTTYLPWLQLYDPWVTHDLRVRDLVAHRVGTDYNVENQMRPVAADAVDLLRRARFVQPVAPFRERFVYSNNMFTTSGQLVRTVSERPWPEFAREHLWSPLDMPSTNASAETTRESANHATPHMLVEGNWAPVRFEYPDRIAVPSGGVNSNAHDMANWLRFQLADGRFNGRTVMRPETVREMHTPQTAVLNPREGVTKIAADPEIASRVFSYAMGWFVSEYRGRQMIWHSGSTDGFICACAMLPEEHLGVVALVNADHSKLPFAIVYRIFDGYLAVHGADWSAKLLAETRAEQARDQEEERKLAASRLKGTKPSLPLADYAGTYDDAAFGRASVTLDGQGLFLKMGAMSGRLNHWHLDTFRTDLVWDTHPYERAFVTFRVDASGRVERMAVQDMAEFRKVVEGTR